MESSFWLILSTLLVACGADETEEPAGPAAAIEPSMEQVEEITQEKAEEVEKVEAEEVDADASSEESSASGDVSDAYTAD